MSEKRRTMTVGVFSAMVREGWSKSELVIDDMSGDVNKRVIIVIDRPSDVLYLREQLDKIENYWKQQLATLSRS